MEAITRTNPPLTSGAKLISRPPDGRAIRNGWPTQITRRCPINTPNLGPGSITPGSAPSLQEQCQIVLEQSYQNGAALDWEPRDRIKRLSEPGARGAGRYRVAAGRTARRGWRPPWEGFIGIAPLSPSVLYVRPAEGITGRRGHIKRHRTWDTGLRRGHTLTGLDAGPLGQQG